jgi:hypothetical protein
MDIRYDKGWIERRGRIEGREVPYRGTGKDRRKGEDSKKGGERVKGEDSRKVEDRGRVGRIVESIEGRGRLEGRVG